MPAGRPRIPFTRLKNRMIWCRVTELELSAISSAAERSGMRVSTWLRRLANLAAPVKPQ